MVTIITALVVFGTPVSTESAFGIALVMGGAIGYAVSNTALGSHGAHKGRADPGLGRKAFGDDGSEEDFSEQARLYPPLVNSAVR